MGMKNELLPSYKMLFIVITCCLCQVATIKFGGMATLEDLHS